MSKDKDIKFIKILIINLIVALYYAYLSIYQLLDPNMTLTIYSFFAIFIFLLCIIAGLIDYIKHFLEVELKCQ